MLRLLFRANRDQTGFKYCNRCHTMFEGTWLLCPFCRGVLEEKATDETLNAVEKELNASIKPTPILYGPLNVQSDAAMESFDEMMKCAVCRKEFAFYHKRKAVYCPYCGSERISDKK